MKRKAMFTPVCFIAIKGNHFYNEALLHLCWSPSLNFSLSLRKLQLNCVILHFSFKQYFFFIKKQKSPLMSKSPFDEKHSWILRKYYQTGFLLPRKKRGSKMWPKQEKIGSDHVSTRTKWSLKHDFLGMN